MKHFNKLLLSLFLLPFFSVAQSNYKPGYVVTSKGDTIHGFIDLQAWDSNPTAISFKPAMVQPLGDVTLSISCSGCDAN